MAKLKDKLSDFKVIKEMLEIEKQSNPFLNLLMKANGWDKWRDVYKKLLVKRMES